MPFKGTFIFNVVFDPTRSETKHNAPVEGGRIEFIYSTGEKITANFIPDGKSLTQLVSCPIVFKSTEATLVITYSENIANIIIANQYAASNDPMKKISDEIVIEKEIDDFVINHEEFKNCSDKALLRRKDQANKITVIAGATSRTLEERLTILDQELQLQIKLEKLLRDGNFEFWMPMAASVRKLICYPEGGSQAYPLLQRIAGMMDKPLMVYTSEIRTRNMKLFEDDILSYGFVFSLSNIPNKSNSVLLDLDCWLNLEDTMWSNAGKQRWFNNNKFFKSLADTYACHVDDNKREIEELIRNTMLSSKKYERSMYTEHLINLSKAIRHIGSSLIVEYQSTSS